ncbi:MAG: DUF2764 family protein [Paludibacteraceae bacterium]|nr:DUF2764 family protein [Paludibacteraceae bacterium]
MGYECLISGLPELQEGSAAPMTMESLEALLADSLSAKDLEQLSILKKHVRSGACRFVRDWQDFNRDLNNVLTAHICRKHGLDPRKNIIGDNELALQLKRPESQKLKDFGLTGTIDSLPEILAVAEIENLMDREKHIDALRFLWLEERTRMIFFSLENVLAYYLMNEMLCRWDILTVEKGEKVFRDIVAEMKSGIKFE